MGHFEKVWELAKKLKSDGCTGVPDGEFVHCCQEHDICYRTYHDSAGYPVTRLEADMRLRRCMRRVGRTWFNRQILPELWFVGVRVFGKRRWNG